MNETTSPPLADAGDKLDELIRENPGTALLAAAGVGLALGILVRSLQDSQPESRMTSVLEEVRERLQEIASPAYKRATDLAQDGASAVSSAMKSGVDYLGDSGVFNKVRHTMKGFFN